MTGAELVERSERLLDRMSHRAAVALCWLMGMLVLQIPAELVKGAAQGAWFGVFIVAGLGTLVAGSRWFQAVRAVSRHNARMRAHVEEVRRAHH